MNRIALFAALLLGVAPAFEARTAIPVVQETALTPAALACRGLPADPAAARRQIVERGWEKGSRTTADGRPVPDDTVEPYGRDGFLLLLSTEPDKVGCWLLGGVKKSLKMKRIVAIVTAALGATPFSVTKDGAMWALPGGQAFMLRRVPKGKETTVQMIVTSVGAARN
jgi:hypothetical protein